MFHSLATTALGGGQVPGIVAGVVLFTALMVGIAEGTGRLIGETEPGQSGFVLAAGLVRRLGVFPPAESPTMRTIGLVGDAAIPLLLVVLGVQLANTDAGAALGRVAPVNALKLGVAPAVGVALVEPTVARTFVLECAMPAAITPLIFAIDLPGRADVTRLEYLSTAILTTTLASVPTLTVLIALLQAGLLV